MITQLEDTLRQYPLIGAGSSLTPVLGWFEGISPILAIVGAFLGIAIGIYTLKIKVLEYKEKKYK